MYALCDIKWTLNTSGDQNPRSLETRHQCKTSWITWGLLMRDTMLVIHHFDVVPKEGKKINQQMLPQSIVSWQLTESKVTANFLVFQLECIKIKIKLTQAKISHTSGLKRWGHCLHFSELLSHAYFSRQELFSFSVCHICLNTWVSSVTSQIVITDSWLLEKN